MRSSEDPVGSFADPKSAPLGGPPWPAAPGDPGRKLSHRHPDRNPGAFLGRDVVRRSSPPPVRLRRDDDRDDLHRTRGRAGGSRRGQGARTEGTSRAKGPRGRLSLSLILSLALCALLVAAAPSAGAFLDDPDLPALLRLLALSLILTPFRAIPMALLERNLDLRRQSAAYALSLLVPLCLVLGLAVRGYGFWALAGGTLATRAVEAVMLHTSRDGGPKS